MKKYVFIFFAAINALAMNNESSKIERRKVIKKIVQDTLPNQPSFFNAYHRQIRKENKQNNDYMQKRCCCMNRCGIALASLGMYAIGFYAYFLNCNNNQCTL